MEITKNGKPNYDGRERVMLSLYELAKAIERYRHNASKATDERERAEWLRQVDIHSRCLINRILYP